MFDITSTVIIAFILVWLIQVLAQWAVIGWLIVGHGKERKDLTAQVAELMVTVASTKQNAPTQYPSHITIPDPEGGPEETIAIHMGDGQFVPVAQPPERLRNTTEDVEGTL